MRTWGRWVHSESLSSIARAKEVVGFTHVRAGCGWLGHYTKLWRMLSSSGVVGFTRARPGGCWVLPGSLGSLARASLGSSWVVGFTIARSGCGWVHMQSLGSLGCALGFVRFILGRCVFLRALGVVGFIRDHFTVPGGRWVHSRAICGSLGSSGDFGFTRVRLRCRWVHPESLGSLARALGVVEFIRGS